MNYKILIVDDEPANLRLLERLFRREHQVVTAASGAEALEMLKMHDVSVIISDQRMPGMTGIELLKRAAEIRPHTVRIILTGYTDINSLVEAINSGVVYKYVAKPWVNEDLQQTVVRAIEHYETIKNQYQLKLQNERLSKQLESARNGFVRFIAQVSASTDAALPGHLRRTSNYAVAIGHQLKLEVAELDQLALAGFLHEIGRIMIPDRTALDPTGLLTDQENRKTVKSSQDQAAQLLKDFPDMESSAAAVRSHGEHFDGSSSSSDNNLTGEQIPLFARIIAVAAAYDRMTAPADSVGMMTHEEAVKKLQRDSGKLFDPKIVEAFSELKSISKIQQIIGEGVIGMRLLRSFVSCDPKDLSTAELLQKFKTEPMLAMDVLKSANTIGDNQPTAQLMSAMSAVGEEKLRAIIGQYGLPLTDDKTTASSVRALRRAIAAQMLTAHTDLIHPDEAYTLGLLYDVGETLLCDLFPGEMLSLEIFDESERPRRQIELFGIDALQISAQMIEACGIPSNLTAALENRHGLMAVGHPTALLLHIADAIAAGDESAENAAAMNAISDDMLEVLNLSRMDLNKIYDRANFITEGRIETPEQVSQIGY